MRCPKCGTTTPDEIVIEGTFTAQYSVRLLHARCLNCDHSDSIRAFDLGPGSWKVVMR